MVIKMPDLHHGLKTLRQELKNEQDCHAAFSEDIDYHTRMLAMKKKDKIEAERHIQDLEQSIADLEIKLSVEG